MVFTVEGLDSRVDFTTKDTTKTDFPLWIVGKGQRVYWKDCNVTVHWKGSQGHEQSLEERSGQGTLSSDHDLYIIGKGGKVKEET